jgi:hypothetical protein
MGDGRPQREEGGVLRSRPLARLMQRFDKFRLEVLLGLRHRIDA